MKHVKTMAECLDGIMARINRGERPIPDYPEGKSYKSFQVAYDSKSMVLICWRDQDIDDFDIIRLTEQQTDCLSYEIEDRRLEYKEVKRMEETGE